MRAYVMQVMSGALLGFVLASGWLYAFTVRKELIEAQTLNVRYQIRARHQRELLLQAQAKYDMAAGLMIEAAEEAGLTDQERAARGCAAVRLLPHAANLTFDALR